jgi:hypothetical protein
MTLAEILDKFHADHPDGESMCYEVVLRGDWSNAPGGRGVFRGAHFQFKTRIPNPFGGWIEGETPLLNATDVPTDLAPGAVPIADLIGPIIIQQQRTIDAGANQIAELGKQIEALNQTISELRKSNE